MQTFDSKTLCMWQVPVCTVHSRAGRPDKRQAQCTPRCKSQLGPTLGRPWADLGPTLGRPWADFGPTLGRLWDDVVTTLGRLRADFVTTFGRLWADFGTTLGRLWYDFGTTLHDFARLCTTLGVSGRLAEPPRLQAPSRPATPLPSPRPSPRPPSPFPGLSNPPQLSAQSLPNQK